MLFHRILLAAFALTLTSAAGGDSAGWPQFRGPGQSGAAPDSPKNRVMAELPAGGLKPVWKIKTGAGFAGPVVAGGMVYLFQREGDNAELLAMAAGDGKELWRFSYPTDYADDFGFDNGPRACPTVADGRVFIHGAEGMLHALDAKTGKLLWAVDTVKDYQSPKGYFGRACAPVFGNGRIVLDIGGKTEKGGAGLVAFDAASGKLVWQATDDEASYSSPLIIGKSKTGPAAGGGELFCWTRAALELLDADSGKSQWRQPFRSRMDASVNACQPVDCGDGRVFVSAAYNVGAALWKIEAGAGTPSQRVRKLWAKQGELDCHYSTPVYRDGYLYGFHGRQEQGQEFRCVDVTDGGVKWTSGPITPGTVLLADGKLLLLTERGELIAAAAKPDGWKELWRDQAVSGGNRAPAAFAEGFLYARGAGELVCLKVK